MSIKSFLEHWFQYFINIIGHNFFAFGIWVDTVRLVKVLVQRHAVEQKGNEFKFVLARKIGKRRSKLALILWPHCRRRKHSAKENLHISRLGLADYLVEIVLHRCDRNATQKVVCTEF